MGKASETETTPPSDALDSVLTGLFREPFRTARPAAQTVPFVFASPHSGRCYPADLVSETWLSPLTLRRSEDAFVDELFESAVRLGAPLIAALFPRVFVDVNRAATELDGTMFDGVLDGDIEAHSARVEAGLGVIPRVVRDGAEIYHRKLSPADAEKRLALLYRPYHAALAGLVEETKARFGAAIVVDCHSMPSASSMPDIVLGDRYGAAAAPSLIRHAELSFEACGFSVARNAPYAGGYTTHLYGRREQGVHALQIEVNRALYLDEARIERGAGFEQLRGRLAEALGTLVAVRAEALLPPRPSLAAE
ncbi:MAG: N-formylglutamate amidohydrolase [Alphaproteobacteria bacterium]|nr:N-formylglutamate amidohydrolase [Alphaproteobacteria bacterium]MDE2495328.1 N-formylglutamate amidohydrolase [Alphaproteobacteria bacterium]